MRLKRGKYQVFARVNGVFRSVPGGMPLTSTPAERAAEREKLIRQHGGVSSTAEPGSIAADVVTYLASPEVAAMASVDERAAHLQLWGAELGADRARNSVTRDDVERVLQTWLQTWSPVTVYHRRTALQQLYKTLNGEDGYNPVKGTTRPDHYRPTDRSVSRATVEAILAAMPMTRAIKRGIRTPSIARLVASAIAETGIPPAELQKLHRRYLDPVARIVRMPWRDKGGGTPAHRRELADSGVAALQALFAVFPDGRIAFVEEAVAHSFKRAARRVCGPETDISLYWLRHAFGADTYRATGDTETVGRLLGHVPGSICTGRYAMGAHADVDRAALAALTAARQAAPAAAAEQRSELKLPVKLPARRKPQSKRRLRRVS